MSKNVLLKARQKMEVVYINTVKKILAFNRTFFDTTNCITIIYGDVFV